MKYAKILNVKKNEKKKNMEIAGKYKKIAVTEKKTSLKIIYSGNFHQFLCVCSSAGSLNVSATG